LLAAIGRARAREVIERKALNFGTSLRILVKLLIFQKKLRNVRPLPPSTWKPTLRGR
jgi:hypothetical protein